MADWVACHELSHVMGLGHSPNGFPYDTTSPCAYIDHDLASTVRSAAAEVAAGAPLGSAPIDLDGQTYLLVVVGPGPATELSPRET